MIPCVRRSAPKQLTKLQDQLTPGRQCPKHRQPWTHHRPEHASKSQNCNRRNMQTQHANTTCTHATHMSHTKQAPCQTPMCDSSETCTTRVGNVANGQFVLRLVADPNNGGLRGLSWILGSVNRACVVLWFHLGVRQPARGLLI